MEIRIRPILAIIVTATVVAAGGLLVLPRLAQLVPSRSSVPVVPTAGAPGTALPAGSPTVTYVDESLGWDWQASCAAQFQQFLVEKLAGQPISAVKIVLVDNTPERKLPFGIRYPDAQGPKTSGNCYNEQGRYTCFIAVAEGEPGADLDVAATLNAPYTLLDMFLARGADPGAIRQTWRWNTFQPLITPAQEGSNRWQSACLHLLRAR
jgi:hypothetical protein